MKKSESARAESDPRETFVSSEGGNREFREYMWDEMGYCNEKLLEPGCMDGGIVGIVTGGESEGRVVYDYEKLCSALAEDYLKYAKNILSCTTANTVSTRRSWKLSNGLTTTRLGRCHMKGLWRRSSSGRVLGWRNDI